MATPYIRYQFDIHGAQLNRLALLGLLVLVAPTVALAQRKASSRITRNRKGVVKSVTVKN